MTRWIGVALVAAACGHPAPAAQPPKVAPASEAAIDAPGKPLEDDLPRLAEREVKMFKDLLAGLTAAGTDCAVASAKVNALADTNADVIAANLKIARAGRAKQLRDALAEYADDLDATAHAIANAITASNCAGNAAFARAFDRISEAS